MNAFQHLCASIEALTQERAGAVADEIFRDWLEASAASAAPGVLASASASHAYWIDRDPHEAALAAASRMAGRYGVDGASHLIGHMAEAVRVAYVGVPA